MADGFQSSFIFSRDGTGPLPSNKSAKRSLWYEFLRAQTPGSGSKYPTCTQRRVVDSDLGRHPHFTSYHNYAIARTFPTCSRAHTCIHRPGNVESSRPPGVVRDMARGLLDDPVQLGDGVCGDAWRSSLLDRSHLWASANRNVSVT